MKKIVCMILIGFAFSGTVYLGVDVSGWYDGAAYSDSEDFDDLGILVGYNHPVLQKEKYGLAVGASYMLQTLYRETWMNSGSGLVYGGQEASFLSVYALPSYIITERPRKVVGRSN